jgi:uncharacterized protein
MSTRTLFGRNKAIEQNIDELLDKVSETGILIVETIYRYLDTGKDDAVEAKINQVAEIKRTCSRLRREIETQLYTQMLIPDLLGDVVSLIEAMHQLVERVHHAMRFSRYYRLSVPEFLVQDAKELATAVGNTLENTVLATRAFFRDFTHVRAFVHKVGFYESECDEIRDRMLEKIYGSDLTLAEMDHFASSVRELDSAADDAERIGNMLTIYAIKRAE